MEAGDRISIGSLFQSGESYLEYSRTKFQVYHQGSRPMRRFIGFGIILMHISQPDPHNMLVPATSLPSVE